MRRVLMTAVILAAGGVASAQATGGYIGEGVQGRAHGGHSAQRALYQRHGLKVPKKYRHHSH